MGNILCKEDKGTHAAVLTGMALGVLTTLMIGAEHGVNYYGEAIYYGALVGTVAGVVTWGYERDFNIGEITVDSITGLLTGIVCGLIPEGAK